MPLKIAQLGQPVLRRVANPLTTDEINTPEFQHFLDAMFETLRESGGVGLAAPQVFESRRVFLAVLEMPEKEDEPLQAEVLLNPVLTPQSEAKAAAWEGCLSFPELLVLV